MRWLLLVVLPACAVTNESGYVRQRTAELVNRLGCYPPGAHAQRCEVVRASLVRCLWEGHRREDCGFDPFEERQSEVGCGVVSDYPGTFSVTRETIYPPYLLEVIAPARASR